MTIEEERPMALEYLRGCVKALKTRNEELTEMVHRLVVRIESLEEGNKKLIHRMDKASKVFGKLKKEIKS